VSELITAGLATKTLMLGVDAGDLAFIQAHIDSLPVFRRLIQHGVLRRLETTSRLLTGSVWPTFYTGTLPGQHGVYHHLQWDPDNMCTRRVCKEWLYSEPFWCELDRHGIRVAVADVPMMFPSRLDNGTEVVNWGSHDQLGHFHCNRPEMKRDIRLRFGKHPMGAEIPVNKNRRQLERIQGNLVTGAQLKGKLIQHLLQYTQWDYFLAVFGECHRGGHILWPDPGQDSLIRENALLEVYQAVDGAIGSILETIDPATVLVILFSLHGMEKNMSQEHFVAPVMQRINALYEQEFAADGGRPRTQHSLMRLLRNQLPAGLQNAIAHAVPVGVRDWVVSQAVTAGYDWERTPAFPLLADYNGYLRFNLKGREASGCLQMGDADYQRYREWIRAGFRGLRAGGNRATLVNQLVPVTEVFPGVRSQFLPDLIITWADQPLVSTLESEVLGRFTARLDTGRSGNHRHEGFVIVHGQGQENRKWQSVNHIVDLAPVVLDSFLKNWTRTI